MSITFNTRTTALGSLRSLDEATKEIGRVYQRLSSGLRINSAVDDPAGLAVSSQLNTKARVLNRGRANVTDGVSALQIADGALNAISGLATRMMELATQAASETVSDEQRSALNQEYKALEREIRRIGRTTEFNGIDLFSGEITESTLEQLTDLAGAGLGAEHVAVSGDGRYVTYHNLETSAIEQRDTVTGATLTIATGVTALYDSDAIRSSESGNTIAFMSANDLVGENGGGANQIYVYDKTSGELSQVTRHKAADVVTTFGWDLSGDGSTVAFSSLTQYVDGGTLADGSTATAAYRLYSLDLGSGVFTEQLSAEGVGYLGFGLSYGGEYLVYGSNSNLLGTNADGGVDLFVKDLSAGKDIVQQITDRAFTTVVLAADITSDGKVYFSSNEDHVSNGNAIYNMFTYDFNSQSLEQLTEFSIPGTLIFKIGGDGDFLTLLTTQNIEGFNPNGNVIKTRLDLDTNEFSAFSDLGQATATSALTFSADGQALYSIANTDLLGENGDGNYELYAYDTATGDLNLSIEAGFGEDGAITASIGSILDRLEGLGAYQITTRDSALGALDAMDRNIELISLQRGAIGASLSRLESANRVLETQALETATAESRIIDADIAEETAELVRQNILQQSATAVLSQSRLQGDIVLKLLAI